MTNPNPPHLQPHQKKQYDEFVAWARDPNRYGDPNADLKSKHITYHCLMCKDIGVVNVGVPDGDTFAIRTMECPRCHRG